MKRLRAPGFAGPVGSSFALLGYCAAVLVARAFVSLEAHCTLACPAINLGDFRLHHFYYGLTLLFLSLTGLAFFETERTRWDSALVFGIGLGLAADETGLLLMNVSYWALGSILAIMLIGLGLASAATYSAMTRGTADFRVLNRSDIFTVLSVFLAMAGFIYFDQPVRIMIRYLAISSWASALFLIVIYGRQHYFRIRSAGIGSTP